ncbi:hypothetical protein H0920_01945 [Acinetobacter sp. C_4_1]|uniref:hypothetical protein n=1 Tax=unclassified Acinetobacter TaxID=196816 RepID=UPI0021B80A85|nr:MULTISPECIES: hypothetical protein [unclassified Acinetobacter]MCT8088973.1 hypothetical protein [Acinetobacter sp. F_3_1]MCT8097129.1 hypothetical protein [Acinetobacter sp. C_3_1]MCT8099878.1 hypothetical protein [Acinetobacter sp. C_4_1]MCT8134277.1 hypothetical protein [Acinetobacter sp. T_3_1]
MQQDILVTYHQLNADAYPLSSTSEVKPEVIVSIFHLFEMINDNELYKLKYPYLKQSHYGRLSNININRSDSRIDLIFSVCDVDAEPSCIENITTEEIRIEERQEDEGLLVRANVSIKVNPNDGSHAIFGIERNPNITPRAFASTLNFLMTKARQLEDLETAFHANHPDLVMERDGKYRKKGEPKILPFKVLFNYDTQFSEEIINAFDNNRVSDISFLQNLPVAQQFDQQGYFQQTAVDVHLKLTTKPIIKPTSNTLVKKARDIKAVFASMTQSKNLDQLRFRIQFEDLAGATRTAHYDASDREISLSKRHKFPSSLRQAVSDVALLNTDLCDNIFRKIEF